MNRKALTGIYSAAHFCVDLACAYAMFTRVYRTPADGELLLIYNFCAFALQMPIGILLDRFGFGHAAAGTGCLLTGAGLFLKGMPSAVTAGVGNALFHAGGGVYVLDRFENSGALGVFVSPGAIGLYLGTLWGKTGNIPLAVPLSMTVIFGLLILFSKKDGAFLGEAAPVLNGFTLSKGEITAAALFTTVVFIRSIGGFGAALPWKTGKLAAAAVICTAGGKAVGGFLSDKLGAKRAAAISMSAAGIMYIFSASPVWGLPALLFFNMSMPMTLRAAADVIKNGRGFSFGLLTFALFAGYVPYYALGGKIALGGDAMAVLSFLSLAMLLGGEELADREKRKRLG